MTDDSHLAPEGVALEATVALMGLPIGNVLLGFRGVSPNTSPMEATKIAEELLAEWPAVRAAVYVNELGLPAVRWWAWGYPMVQSVTCHGRVMSEPLSFSPEHLGCDWDGPQAEEDGDDR